MIVSTSELFKHAYGKYAIGAYNINNLEQLVGLFRGNLGKSAQNDGPCDATKSSPFILSIFTGAIEYTNQKFLEGLVRSAEEVFPEAIFAVHLDHGYEQICYDCIDSGFYSSVMIDASAEEFKKNIEITRRVVERAHDKGIVVEAELGHVGGAEGDIVSKVKLTDPSMAAEFIDKSGCDSLAVAVGTSHGAFKFSGKQGLHFDVLAEIQKAVPPNFPLVMHGASSVPQDWILRINNAGGQLAGASGVNESEYLPAAWLGVCKINVDTDGRLIWCAIHREEFQNNPQNFDLRPAGKKFMSNYADFIMHKNSVLGSFGQLEGVRELLNS